MNPVRLILIVVGIVLEGVAAFGIAKDRLEPAGLAFFMASTIIP